MLEDSVTASIQYINVSERVSRLLSSSVWHTKVSPPSLNDEAVQEQTWNMSG